ncbi:hypothetical protein DSO57_1007990 [Entomophthora muscae]|uniref:Uncharacterized protein n=1 Tax=Entomophthora muscae TaxID=34485 RepID=A0ACC2TI85_9FUNG|nr:hypothetical protein DSO57_1007990 [Entomophthora muscae]
MGLRKLDWLGPGVKEYGVFWSSNLGLVLVLAALSWTSLLCRLIGALGRSFSWLCPFLGCIPPLFNANWDRAGKHKLEKPSSPLLLSFSLLQMFT